MAAGYDAPKDIDIGCKAKSGKTTLKVEGLADGVLLHIGRCRKWKDPICVRHIRADPLIYGEIWANVILAAARSGLTLWRWSHMTNNTNNTYMPAAKDAGTAAREVTR